MGFYLYLHNEYFYYIESSTNIRRLNMEKAFEITKLEQVLLFCDKCAGEMKKKDILRNEDGKISGYVYVCNRCGAEEVSKTDYPYQRAYYNKEVVE